MTNEAPRVKLTKRVIRGLALMKSAIGTDPQALILGHDHKLSIADKKEMEAYECAVRWIEYRQAIGGAS